ncbi:hypothetical protein SAMN05216344_13127 [Polaromonas sp. OV174]|uniref:hypothetical protein n=1 Tax=Polaromonas sp. OV174 TaxID=1855300 RepID=UPI0008E5B709|nr:hypothetical protein [Polaromonas sp. OV174]SFC69178.1 hypothetical protein SAMN05216344_13127 [Polaromonas sp. OV174]
MLKIALLGAPHSGKTQLAAALTASATPVIVVVADTSALRAERYDLALLMGLDGSALMNSPEQEAADQSIRAALAHTAQPYQVIYGSSAEHLSQALQAIERLLPATGSGRHANPSPGKRAKAWVWACDKCSDPQCEYRLLSDLLAQRAAAI